MRQLLRQLGWFALALMIAVQGMMPSVVQADVSIRCAGMPASAPDCLHKTITSLSDQSVTLAKIEAEMPCCRAMQHHMTCCCCRFAVSKAASNANCRVVIRLHRYGSQPALQSQVRHLIFPVAPDILASADSPLPNVARTSQQTAVSTNPAPLYDCFSPSHALRAPPAA